MRPSNDDKLEPREMLLGCLAVTTLALLAAVVSPIPDPPDPEQQAVAQLIADVRAAIEAQEAAADGGDELR